MKATLNGVEVEGTPEELATLIRTYSEPTAPQSVSSRLTPKQAEVYHALQQFSNGAHYSLVAEATGLEAGVVNSRLNDIVKSYSDKLIQRIGSGVFKVVG
ncbi:hypothetical protein SEA_LEOPARD_69 [Mycobacterium phage Leopard]|uniref:Uncharacterized protein n=1 Tax=Mycobacterium phage Onyinye TaxID=2686235 RepID=A0A6B9LFC7_9CAUD|nr:hypothetical protein PP339_gp070 [Mycobacterium phage Onyinye]QHB37475.1 hypothetical protein SEA_ONYINYE_70 [Mycobacterium phage Onyinye]UOW92946.1 hypothetical protein SEA_LEOPARD_69 [Mycobacterium phage Leopard]WKW85232.1 hypothetical protein SEA_AIKOY__70 [Mycobacterium phage Aikoy]